MMTTKRFNFGKAALALITLLLVIGCEGLDVNDIPGTDDFLDGGGDLPGGDLPGGDLPGGDLLNDGDDDDDDSQISPSPEPLPSPGPIVLRVTVTEASNAITVQPRQSLQFSAEVEGENSPATTVTWSIVTSHHAGTTINSGLLFVSEYETQETIVVRATSTEDTTKHGEYSVAVILDTATLSVVVVAADSATSVPAGGTLKFLSQVIGEDHPSQDVLWTIETSGIHPTQTYIQGDGILHVALTESNDSLTIKAASAENEAAYATITVEVSRVTGVTVNGGGTVVPAGYFAQFTAAVTGTHNPVQTVVWSIDTAGKHADTNITPGGQLNVAAGEMSPSLVVRATSTADSSKYGTKTINVSKVISVTVTAEGNAATIAVGATLQFTAQLTGNNLTETGVDWSVAGTTGTKNTNTRINAAGLLTVFSGEQQTSLTITARALADMSITGTRQITVLVPTVNTVTVTANGNPALIVPNTTLKFYAEVTGTNNPPQTVTWQITSNKHENTTISSGGILSVAQGETHSPLKIRATSTVNTSKFGEKEMPVLVPTVTSVSVGADNNKILPGATLQLYAMVTGTNNPAQTVTWSIIEAPTHVDTKINGSGVLSVSHYETQTSLTIRATSAFDSTKSGTKTIAVSNYEVSTLAGTEAGGTTYGYVNGAGTVAKFNAPSDVVIGNDGALYVADTSNHAIRKVTTSGVTSTFAGSESGQWGSDTGTGTAARFNYPKGIVKDSSGNFFVIDNIHRITKITSGGAVTNFVNIFWQLQGGGYDAYPNLTAIAIDGNNNLYVAAKLIVDSDYQYRIYKVLPNGQASHFAGSGSAGSADGQGTAAQFNNPSGIAIDSNNNLYVADTNNNRIRKITPGGLVSTLQYALTNPRGVAVGGAYLYIAYSNSICRIHTVAANSMEAIAGSSSSGLNEGPGPWARFQQPKGMAVSGDNIYVVDSVNYRIRKITRMLN
jgi:sugar lactone lactonase YvrE